MWPKFLPPNDKRIIKVLHLQTRKKRQPSLEEEKENPALPEAVETKLKQLELETETSSSCSQNFNSRLPFLEIEELPSNSSSPSSSEPKIQVLRRQKIDNRDRRTKTEMTCNLYDSDSQEKMIDDLGEEFLTIVKVTPRRPENRSKSNAPSLRSRRRGSSSFAQGSAEHKATEDQDEQRSDHNTDPLSRSQESCGEPISEEKKDQRPCHIDAKSTNSTSPSPVRKKVHFKTLHIRKYNQILGDHPCCTSGLPLALGWDYQDEESIQIDDYETLKKKNHEYRMMNQNVKGPRSSSARMNAKFFKLDCETRRRILSGVGLNATLSGVIGSASCSDLTSLQQLQEGREGELKENEDKNITESNTASVKGVGYYNETELKRAERRLYRERQRCSMIAGKRRSIQLVNQFFTT